MDRFSSSDNVAAIIGRCWMMRGLIDEITTGSTRLSMTALLQLNHGSNDASHRYPRSMSSLPMSVVTDRPVTRRKKVTFDKNAKVQALVQGAQAFKEKMLALEAEAEVREEQQALARAVSTRQYAVVRRTGSVTGRAKTT
jgi:hypothetical protein